MENTRRWASHLGWVEWKDETKTVGIGKGTEFIFDKDILIIPDTMPDKLLVSNEFLEHANGAPWFARDGALIVIQGSNAMVCYELKEESPMKLSWYAEKVKHEIQTN